MTHILRYCSFPFKMMNTVQIAAQKHYHVGQFNLSLEDLGNGQWTLSTLTPVQIGTCNDRRPLLTIATQMLMRSGDPTSNWKYNYEKCRNNHINNGAIVVQALSKSGKRYVQVSLISWKSPDQCLQCQPVSKQNWLSLKYWLHNFL